MAKNVKVTPEEFYNQICLMIDEFEGEVDKRFKKDLNASANVILEELHNANPAGAGRYHSWSEGTRTSEGYNQGWTKTATNKLGEYHITIYNKDKPGLTHLLQKGHVAGHGHTFARPFPHIAPAAQKGAEDLERRLNKNG